MDLEFLEEFLEKGYTVYYIEGIREYTERVYGYDLREYGCRYLAVE
jgi:hypothetical protein